MKKFFLLMLTAIFTVSLTSTAFANGVCRDEHFIFYGVGHCNADAVNVRTGPGTQYKSVGLAYKGDIYGFHETMGEVNGTVNQDFLWNHVHGEHIGWMYAKYFTFDEPARSGITILERA